MRPSLIINRAHRRGPDIEWLVSTVLCVIGIVGLLWLTFCYGWAAVTP
jgi:hypothetical protein